MDASSKPSCIFCKIARGEIPSTYIYENDDVVVFPDINPVSPIHLLIVPKAHYDSILEVPSDLMGRIHEVILLIANRKGVVEKGFRVVNNCGPDGGQAVPHVHWHFLAGRTHDWPPG